MSRVPVLLLVSLLAACSKPEPPVAVPAAPAPPPPASVVTTVSPDGLPAEATAKEGESLFNQNCATCHMADGGGVPYLQPSIQGSAWLSNPDPQLLLTLILRGSGVLGEAAQAYENDMAPHTFLTDAEIAALATYARQRFAVPPVNEPVTPAQVALARSRPGLPE